jgi:hypothetical protein
MRFLNVLGFGTLDRKASEYTDFSGLLFRLVCVTLSSGFVTEDDDVIIELLVFNYAAAALVLGHGAIQFQTNTQGKP